MNIENILSQLDNLLHQCKLQDAEKFLLDSLSLAKQSDDNICAITLYNELIGFYRDGGKFESALKCCDEVIDTMNKIGLSGTKEYATTLLNVANAYRASGKSDEAFSCYDEVLEIYKNTISPEDSLYASYYNNLSLLYQEVGDWQSSCNCLQKALELVKKQKDSEIQIAISSTNLAVSLLHMNETEKALKYLENAFKIFSGRSPSDFHYSATLAALGDASFQKMQYEKATEYYEAALSEIELHMGKNNFYEIVKQNCEEAYKKIGGRKNISGIELCRRYYKMFGEPVLDRLFSDYKSKIAVGLVGEGSDCFGYDDEISKDHDFGAGFCLWVTDDVYNNIGKELQKAYDSLPRYYMGFERICTEQGKNRVGVCRISDFYKRIIGISNAPETEQEWLSLDENMLCTAVNGEVFQDDLGEFTKIREILKRGYPMPVRLRRIAQQTAIMAQSGQYNYKRMLLRGETSSAWLALSEFIKSSMHCVHLLNGVYAPYYKWLVRSTRELPRLSVVANLVEKIILCDVTDEKTISSYIEEICYLVREEMQKQNISYGDEIYMQIHAEQSFEKAKDWEEKTSLVDEIVLLEWNAFDKVQNEGVRAGCQDDWDTFSIMRKSQYFTWSIDLLEKYKQEFISANQRGWNLITEKYGWMMESTAPDDFAKIKDKFPTVSEDKIKLREAIVSIQVGWMEKFSEKYPNLAGRARVIHTSEDTKWQTSYETYLRGELTTYSDDLLYEYGRFIVSLYNDNKNLAEMIMQNTVNFYGYVSIDDAEKKSAD